MKGTVSGSQRLIKRLLDSLKYLKVNKTIEKDD